VLSHPKRVCSPLEIGFAVEVRDTAISQWLPAKVVGLKPVTAQPDGWDTGFRWSAYRHNGLVCRPGSQQMAAAAASTGRDPSSKSVEAYQEFLPDLEQKDCQKGCALRQQQQQQPKCLCLFDVDRTLTSKQGQASGCPGVKEVYGVSDTAYGGGPLVLSELAQRLTDTFCGQCYRGVISAGHVSGLHSEERKVLLEALGGPRWTLSDVWSAATPNVSSMLVIGAHDYHKQEVVRSMVDWLRQAKGVEVEDQEVHFFDDSSLNTPPFTGTGFNARQVSCKSRGRSLEERAVGFCGGRVSEVVRSRGVKTCADAKADEDRDTAATIATNARATKDDTPTSTRRRKPHNLNGRRGSDDQGSEAGLLA